MISVIVPVFNAEKYLYRCIDSILSQSYTDFELLLIDDGSLDNCGAICDEYAARDYRVRAFHKENGGVSSARNVGLGHARGEWITFVDSDDWIEGNLLSELNLYGEFDLVVGSFYIVKDFEYIERLIHPNQYYGDSLRENIVRLASTIHFRTPWGILYKREIIVNNNILFDENIHSGEDTLFVLNYLKFTKSIRTTTSLCYYYNIDNEQSLSKNVREFDSYFYAMETFYKTTSSLEKVFHTTDVRRLYLENASNYISKQIYYIYNTTENNLWFKLRKLIELKNNLYVLYVLKDRRRLKKRKKVRIFDLFALKGTSLMLLIYIYICRGKIY